MRIRHVQRGAANGGSGTVSEPVGIGFRTGGVYARES